MCLQFCTALHTLLMMTAEFMLSKRPVLRFTAALFFLLKDYHSFYAKALGVCAGAYLEGRLLTLPFSERTFKLMVPSD